MMSYTNPRDLNQYEWDVDTKTEDVFIKLAMIDTKSESVYTHKKECCLNMMDAYTQTVDCYTTKLRMSIQ